MQNQPAICLNCHEPIKKGRSDKKFCDGGCKDEYYNKIKVQENKEFNRVINVLKKNRRVLKGLYNPLKTDKLFSREQLIKAGFDFGFSTHITVTKIKAYEIRFCLDFGFREMTPGNFQIYPSFSRVNVKEGGEFVVN